MEILSGLWDRFLGGNDEDLDDGEPGLGWSDYEEYRHGEGMDYGLFDSDSGVIREVSGRSVDEMTLDWWDEIDEGGLRR
jgi:hypothetical protein